MKTLFSLRLCICSRASEIVTYSQSKNGLAYILCLSLFIFLKYFQTADSAVSVSVQCPIALGHVMYCTIKTVLCLFTVVKITQDKVVIVGVFGLLSCVSAARGWGRTICVGRHLHAKHRQHGCSLLWHLFTGQLWQWRPSTPQTAWIHTDTHTQSQSYCW